MSAIPPTRQIQFDQIPGAPTWFANFLQTLNGILGPLYDMSNKGVTYGDNIPAQYKTLTLTGPLNPNNPLTFQSTLKAAPVECIIVKIQRTNGTPTVKTSDGGNIAISLNQWSTSGGTITLDELVGIQSGCTYQITFKVA